MNFIKQMRSFFNRSPTAVRTQLIQQYGNGFYSWHGTIYRSDIVRSCIRPFYKSIGKLKATQLRQTNNSDLKVSPDLYIKMLLEYPNPYMTGQVMWEKMAIQLALNNNAFAYINRDDNGFAMELYPISAVSVEAVYDANFRLYLRFVLSNGQSATFSYDDIIHLRQDFKKNDLFGEPNTETLLPLMEIVTTIDQGIVKAVKNSAVIKWLLKYKIPMRPEDIKANTNKFIESFMQIEDADADAENLVGAAGTDTKADVTQVTPTDYVPNASQMDKTIQRIYNYFGVNEKIIQSKYGEDDWNAYFESVIEPVSIQMSNEFTRKIFSMREIGFGNRIVFEASNLEYASMATKLNLFQMVDRGALTPNEWRQILHMGPIEGGDKPIRRADTPTVGGETNGENKN